MVRKLFRILRNLYLTLVVLLIVAGYFLHVVEDPIDSPLKSIISYQDSTISYQDNPEKLAEQLSVKLPSANHPDLRQLALDKLFYDRDYNWKSLRKNWEGNWFIPREWVREGEKELTIIREEVLRALNARLRDPKFRALPQREKSLRFWKAVYSQAAAQNRTHLTNIVQGFEYMEQEGSLTKSELVKLVLHFIQAIPYKIPDGDLGLTTPQKALVQRFGDCDTKSLFLIMVLRELGVDAVMLISFHYKHAMVGIAIPSLGESVQMNGRRYYFTETTARGHLIGILPSKIDNRHYWDSMRIY